MKTAELTGALLDYWTGRAEEADFGPEWNQGAGYVMTGGYDGRRPEWYSPSTNWAQGGPLIEKYNLDIDKIGPAQWLATDNGDTYGIGDTPLQAICRAVVRAAFGDDVEEVAV